MTFKDHWFVQGMLMVSVFTVTLALTTAGMMAPIWAMAASGSALWLLLYVFHFAALSWATGMLMFYWRGPRRAKSE